MGASSSFSTYLIDSLSEREKCIFIKNDDSDFEAINEIRRKTSVTNARPYTRAYE